MSITLATKYYYVHHRQNKAARGGKTIAMTLENKTLRFAVARCHPLDNYCRKTGRDLAEQKLEAGFEVYVIPNVTCLSNAITLASTIASLTD